MGRGGVFLRKLRANVVDEPAGFVWIEQGKIAASGLPSSHRQVEWLSKNGIKSILTLTEMSLPPDFLDGTTLSVEHVPMEDHGIPTLDALERGASYVEGQVNEGRPVVVHCLAGEGRTGCVLAAYAIKSRGMSAAEALSTLRKVKNGFVERPQEKAVFDYARRLKAASGEHPAGQGR